MGLRLSRLVSMEWSGLVSTGLHGAVLVSMERGWPPLGSSGLHGEEGARANTPYSLAITCSMPRELEQWWLCCRLHPIGGLYGRDLGKHSGELGDAEGAEVGAGVGGLQVEIM